MTFHARSGRRPECTALLRVRVSLAAVVVSMSVTPWAAGQGFDSYAADDDAQSVMINEGVVPPPSEHHAYVDDGYGIGCDNASCRGAHCGGCSRCQGYPPTTAGIVNRALGDACPRWTAQVDALMLWQSNIPTTSLLVFDNPVNPATFLSTNQLLTDMAVGPRVALMLHLDQEHAIEGNYFYVGSISTTREFTAPLPEQLVWDELANIVQFGNIDSGTITANGEIQSFELNWRHRHCGSPFTWLAGFRWVEWNDSLRLADSYSSQSGFGDDLLYSEANNDLYGAQLGVDANLLTLWDSIRFNGIAKAGVYGNAVDATTIVQTDRQQYGPPRSFTGTTSQTGFFG